MKTILKVLLIAGLVFSIVRTGPGGTGGSGGSGNKPSPSQAFGSINAANGVNSAHSSINQKADAGRPKGRDGENSESTAQSNNSALPQHPNKWSDDNNLNSHFDTHGNEMGFDNKAEYQYAAMDLVDTSGGPRPNTQVKVEGDKSYFLDTETGEFAVAGNNGIITYFTPSPNPQKYFDEQTGTVVSNGE